MYRKLIFTIFIVSILLSLILGLSYLNQLSEVNAKQRQNSNNEKTTDNLLFIGNSILQPADLKALLGDDRIRNMAIPGLTTTDAIMMSNDLVPENPKKIFIMLGVNDIKAKTPFNITLRNIDHFIYTIKRISPSTVVSLMSILPVNEYIFSEIKNEDIIKMNILLSEYATKYKINYIDLYQTLLDNESNLDKKYTQDGLHINKAAFIKLRPQLKSNL